MALRDFRIENLTRRTQLMLFGALSLALVGAFYWFWLRGALRDRAALRVEIRRLEQTVAQNTMVASQRDRFRRELAQLEARLEFLRAILPDQKETPLVLRGVQEMAAASSLHILKFFPLPVVPRAFYSDWPITIEVEGSYGALGEFFERIGQSTRLINVTDITVRGLEGSTDSNLSLKANCTATTYVFREELTSPPKGKGDKQ